MVTNPNIIINSIIALAIVLVPIILVICGAALRKSKKKLSKLLLIVGGSIIGLFVLLYVLEFLGAILVLISGFCS